MLASMGSFVRTIFEHGKEVHKCGAENAMPTRELIRNVQAEIPPGYYKKRYVDE